MQINLKRNAIPVLDTHTIVRKGTVTEITCPFDVNVFEKLRFFHHLADVFKFLYLETIFSKTVNAVFSGDGKLNRREKILFSVITHFLGVTDEMLVSDGQF